MVTLAEAPASVVSRGKLDWSIMRSQLNHVNELAMRDLIPLVRTAQQMEPWAGREYLTDALAALVGTYGSDASALTAIWWDEIMADDTYVAETAEMPPVDQLRTEVAWGTTIPETSRDDVLSRMARLTQKHIFGAHRNTVQLNALNTKTGYARYAMPNACAFCRILASRGAVYGSQDAALYVGASAMRKHYSDGRDRGYRLKKGRVRGTQKAGDKYHDHCRCIVAPLTRNVDPNFPDYVDKFAEEYQQAVEQVNKDNPGTTASLSMITRAMRAQGNGK